MTAATHDTTLRFAIGTLDDAHRFESATFAQDEGIAMCQHLMKIDGMRPMTMQVAKLGTGYYCEIVGAITGTSYGYLRAIR